MLMNRNYIILPLVFLLPVSLVIAIDYNMITSGIPITIDEFYMLLYGNLLVIFLGVLIFKYLFQKDPKSSHKT